MSIWIMRMRSQRRGVDHCACSAYYHCGGECHQYPHTQTHTQTSPVALWLHLSEEAGKRGREEGVRCRHHAFAVPGSPQADIHTQIKSELREREKKKQPPVFFFVRFIFSYYTLFNVAHEHHFFASLIIESTLLQQRDYLLSHVTKAGFVAHTRRERSHPRASEVDAEAALVLPNVHDFLLCLRLLCVCRLGLFSAH